MGRPLIDLTGKRFDKLVVLNRVKDRRSGTSEHFEVWYRIQCDCGKKKSMRGYLIRDGRARSCGCGQRTSKYGKLGYGCKEYRMWAASKYRAKSLGVPHTIVPADIKMPKFCPLLGIRISYNNKVTSRNSPSIDRVIPSRGYTKKNILTISHHANQIKNDATLEELKTITKNLEKIWHSFI